MGRFRRLDEREEEYWIRCRDKEEAFNLMKQRREQMGIEDDRIPYYIRGRRLKTKREPVYNNGRLIRNQWGEERVYLDWVIAEQTDLFKGVEE